LSLHLKSYTTIKSLEFPARRFVIKRSKWRVRILARSLSFGSSWCSDCCSGSRAGVGVIPHRWRSTRSTLDASDDPVITRLHERLGATFEGVFNGVTLTSSGNTFTPIRPAQPIDGEKIRALGTSPSIPEIPGAPPADSIPPSFQTPRLRSLWVRYWT